MESVKEDMLNYQGWKRWYPSDEELANFYVDKKNCPIINELKENEYLIICDKDENILGIYKKQDEAIVDIAHPSFKSISENTHKSRTINPRNAEQKCAFDMLTDDRSTVKLITGKWGCG